VKEGRPKRGGMAEGSAHRSAQTTQHYRPRQQTKSGQACIGLGSGTAGHLKNRRFPRPCLSVSGGESDESDERPGGGGMGYTVTLSEGTSGTIEKIFGVSKRPVFSIP